MSTMHTMSTGNLLRWQVRKIKSLCQLPPSIPNAKILKHFDQFNTFKIYYPLLIINYNHLNFKSRLKFCITQSLSVVKNSSLDQRAESIVPCVKNPSTTIEKVSKKQREVPVKTDRKKFAIRTRSFYTLLKTKLVKRTVSGTLDKTHAK